MVFYVKRVEVVNYYYDWTRESLINDLLEFNGETSDGSLTREGLESMSDEEILDVLNDLEYGSFQEFVDERTERYSDVRTSDTYWSVGN